jgi:hypothetical protein
VRAIDLDTFLGKGTENPEITFETMNVISQHVHPPDPPENQGGRSPRTPLTPNKEKIEKGFSDRPQFIVGNRGGEGQETGGN